MAATPNVSNGRIQMENGRAYVTRHAAEEGWSLLSDLYKAEGNPEGFELFKQYEAARAANRTDRAKVSDEHGEGKRPTPVPMPEEYLPAEVVRRRSGESAVSVGQFELPPIAAKAKSSSRARVNG